MEGENVFPLNKPAPDAPRESLPPQIDNVRPLPLESHPLAARAQDLNTRLDAIRPRLNRYSALDKRTEEAIRADVALHEIQLTLSRLEENPHDTVLQGQAHQELANAEKLITEAERYVEERELRTNAGIAPPANDN